MLPLEESDPSDVGGLTLVGRLGVGGMGVVYLARQRTGDAVALKVIRPELSADPEFSARFATEVRHALSVTGPFMADAREASTSMTPQFIAWTYVPGETLGLTVRQLGPLSADELDALGAALADSLGRLHLAGIVHRDLKPSNVQIGPTGPVLLDLGVSRSLDDSALTRPQASIGTPAWMSPEQWQGDRGGPAGDMWAWGAVMAFSAGGQHPFGRGTGEAIGYRVLHEAPTVPPLRDPLAGLVTRALDKDPSVRPQWRDVLDALSVDSDGIEAFVGTRWSRLRSQALRQDENVDPPTVLIRTDSPTVSALAPTKFDSRGDRPAGHRRALAAVAAVAIVLAGVLTAAAFARDDATGPPVAESSTPASVAPTPSVKSADPTPSASAGAPTPAAASGKPAKKPPGQGNGKGKGKVKPGKQKGHKK